VDRDILSKTSRFLEILPRLLSLLGTISLRVFGDESGRNVKNTGTEILRITKQAFEGCFLLFNPNELLIRLAWGTKVERCLSPLEKRVFGEAGLWRSGSLEKWIISNKPMRSIITQDPSMRRRCDAMIWRSMFHHLVARVIFSLMYSNPNFDQFRHSHKISIKCGILRHENSI